MMEGETPAREREREGGGAVWTVEAERGDTHTHTPTHGLGGRCPPKKKKKKREKCGWVASVKQIGDTQQRLRAWAVEV